MEKNNLPKCWEQISFEQIIASIIGGDWGKPISNKTSENYVQVNVIRSTELQKWKKEKGKTAEQRIIKKTSMEKRKLNDGDIILEVSGGGTTFPVGRTVLIDKTVLSNFKNSVICSNFFRKISFQKCVLPKFVDYFLNFKYLQGSTRKFRNQSVNIQNLKVDLYFSNLLIPIPPLNEQKRIVAKIEELFSIIDFSRKIIFIAKDRLNIFRESLLQNAIIGQITMEWRKNNKIPVKNDLISEIKSEQVKHFAKLFENDSKNRRLPKYDDDFNSDDSPVLQIPEQWKMYRLGEIILHLTDYHSNASYESLRDNVTLLDVPDHAYMIRATNFVKNNFSTEMKYISKKSYDFLLKSKIMGGEILIGKIGNAGSVYFMPTLNHPASLAMNLFALRFPKQVNSKYVYYHLISLFSRQNIKNYVKGVGNPTIDKKSIRSLWISFPPIEEQNVIVEELEKILTTIQKSVENLDILLKQYELLRLSILKHAFEGKLIPQDPNDEPAEILLQKIRQEKQMTIRQTEKPKKNKNNKSKFNE